MEHSDLVAEMTQVEHLSTQDRLHLARMRRAHQLKVAKQKEKEWLKEKSRRERNANHNNNNNNSNNSNNINNNQVRKKNRHITFENSVVVLEAAARNDIDEVQRLLDQGVSPDATNEDGLTPLHQCCIDNNAEMLRLLLDFDADVNAKDSEKWTPLHAAATCGHLSLVKILISRGANLLAVNVDGNMPYDLCDDEETLDCIEAEMSRRGVTQELIDETRASTENQMLQDLIDIANQGGDLEIPDKHQATPLHIASANGYNKVVEFLLDNHVRVDAVDKDLWTAVHAAACWGHLEVLVLLALSGADLNAKNKNEETPSDICEDAEIRERIEQLKSEQCRRKAERKQHVRRSQSNNTRAQSVRRTSLRDKTLTTKKDAVDETRIRLQAQEGYTAPDSTTPGSISNTPDGIDANTINNNNNNNKSSNKSNLVPISNSNNNNDNNIINNNIIPNNINHNNNNTQYTSNGQAHGQQQNKPQNPLYGQTTTSTTSSYPINNYDSALNRRSPEGKDNETFINEDNNNNNKQLMHNNNNNNNLTALPVSSGTVTGTTTLNNKITTPSSTSASASTINNNQQKIGNDISAEIFSASNENGKINVQVTVLVDTHNLDHSITGTTLANLKKQRAQSRTSSTSENGSILNHNTTTSNNNNNLNNNHNNANVNNNNNNNNNSIIGNHHQHHQNSLQNHHIIGGHQQQQQHHNQQQQQQMELAIVSSDVKNPSITKFCGVTSDVVSDSTRSRRCCSIM